MEVVLRLRPLGDREAQADEHILETFLRLGHEVLVPVTAPGAGVLGEIEAFRLEPPHQIVGLEGLPAGGRRGVEARTGVVDGAAHGLALVGAERAEA